MSVKQPWGVFTGSKAGCDARRQGGPWKTWELWTQLMLWGSFYQMGQSLLRCVVTTGLIEGHFFMISLLWCLHCRILKAKPSTVSNLTIPGELLLLHLGQQSRNALEQTIFLGSLLCCCHCSCVTKTIGSAKCTFSTSWVMGILNLEPGQLLSESACCFPGSRNSLVSLLCRWDTDTSQHCCPNQVYCNALISLWVRVLLW